MFAKFMRDLRSEVTVLRKTRNICYNDAVLFASALQAFLFLSTNDIVGGCFD